MRSVKESFRLVSGLRARLPKLRDQVLLRSHRLLPGLHTRYADVALPLTNLTQKGSPEKVKRGEDEERAFLDLKDSLAKPPILVHLPDENKVFKLKVDASDTGLGAVLMQEHDGEDFPVSYGSRKLLLRELHYATIEKECLQLCGVFKSLSSTYVAGFLRSTQTTSR